MTFRTKGWEKDAKKVAIHEDDIREKIADQKFAELIATIHRWSYCRCCRWKGIAEPSRAPTDPCTC